MMLPMKLLRTLHLYLSLLGLALITFFAVTGFMLNHEHWFRPDEVRQTTETTGQVPRDVLPADLSDLAELPADVRTKLVQLLRTQFAIRAELKDVRLSAESVDVDFESAGHVVVATIALPAEAANPSPLAVTVRDESTGIVGRLSDLHRKITKHTDNERYLLGNPWRLMVDASAIVLLITSFTGLFLWIGAFQRKRLATICLAAGAAVFVVAYLILVP